MTLPPLWKIRREVGRLRSQTTRGAGRLIYDPIRKPIYDWSSDWWQKITPGSLPLTDRVAVFVVFQPKGLAASILLTLQHLRQNGYSVFVVSNGPLQEADRASLAAGAALVMERPNVGYDFGAYRDGIRHLWSLGANLSRLVLMNDSTWFPLRQDDDSLARMEALGADLAGHIFKTENEKKRGNDHVESHLLMVSGAFFRSSSFHGFWNGYRMSDRRETTIDFGEKGITQVALRAGWRVETLMGRDWLLGVLRGLDDAALRTVLHHTADGFKTGARTAVEIRRAAARGEPWRDDYLDWVHETLSDTTNLVLSATFIMPATIYGCMGFLKKGKEAPFHEARRKLLELDAKGMIPALDETVRSEISQSVRAWTPPTEQEAQPRQRLALRPEAKR